MYYSHTFFFWAFIFLISKVNGSKLYYHHFVGEDAHLQWTLSPPVQDPITIVYVRNPANTDFFEARGTVYNAYKPYNDRVVYNGDTTKSNMNFTLKNVATSDAGAYIANYDDQNHAGATLVIYVKPSAASITTRVPVIGTDLVLSCTSQSNSVPADHDLVMTYTWFLNGADLPDDNRFVAANQQLTIKVIQMSDKGSKIRCRADESPALPSDLSQEYTVDPEYKPGSVGVTPTTTRYTPLVGTQLGPIACKADCKPDCTFRWRRDTTIVVNSPVLTIASVQRGMTGNYSCIATNKHGSEMTTHMVDVTVQFGSENLVLNPTKTTYRPLSGTGLGPITCSAECEPTCSYQWSLDGNSISTDSNILSIQSIERGQTGTYTCTARNKHGTKTVNITVVVEFGPLNITMNTTTTSYRVLKGRRLGPIACSAICEPSCSYQWSHNGNKVSPASGVLDIPSIQRVQNGTYTCTSSNKHGTKNVSIAVVVEFGPEKIALTPTNTTYRPLQGTRLGPISCSSDGEPPCSYKWSSDGNIIPASEVLDILNIQRGQTGTYTCTASNPHGTKTVSVTVVVEYEPSNIMLNPDAGHYEPVQGTRVGPVKCSADCEPACTYQWSRNDNDIIPVSSVLNITSIQRGQTGSYTCTATNKHGTKKISVTVSVKFSPIALRFYSRPLGPDVDENKTVYFACETEGYPVPTVTIYFKGNATVYKQERNLFTTLTLENVNCLLTGYYFCNAINEIGNVTINSTINVLCSPHLDHRKKIDVDHGIGNGENLNITGSFIANPTPTFTWKFRKNDSQIETVLKNDTESFYFINQQNDYISYSSRAIRTIRGEHDFGQYILEASNAKGSAILVQRVFSRRHPDPPVFVKVECLYFDKAEITWISKYNGGNEQYFRIGVKTLNDTTFKLFNSYGDPGQDKVITGTITHLKGKTTYYFAVFAINKFGLTSISSSILCETPEPYALSKNNADTGSYVASIVLFALSALLFLATGFGIQYIRRRKLQNKGSTQKDNKGNDKMNTYETLGEHNPTSVSHYQEIGTSRMENTGDGDTRNLYANLGKRDVPNVYEKIKPHETAQHYENTCFNPDV